MPIPALVGLILLAIGYGVVAGRLAVPHAGRQPQWLAVVVADLVVLALGQWLLAAEDLLAVAVLGPVLVVAVAGQELGRRRALRVADLAIAIMAAIHGFGPGPELTWRTIVAVDAAGAVAVWAVFVGTTARAAQEELAAERASLEALKEQVVTTVSHELRTPLTIIQGLTSTLVSRWDALPSSRS